MSDKPKRRWYLFSLKTLLVALSLLCLAPGGYVVYEHAKARRQKAAVEAIENLGGTVKYDWTVPVRSAKMRQALGDESFGNVNSVQLNGTQVTDFSLANLTDLNRIKVLYLNDTQVTDAGLKHLAGLKGLTHLDLDKTQVTDAGVAELQKALPKCVIQR